MAKKSDNPNSPAGFIRLPRALLESYKWNNLRLRQQKLFLYILLNAQYAPYVYKHNGTDIQLMPGELCISMRRLVEDFNRTTKFKDEKIDLPFLQRAVSTFLKVGLTDTRTDTGITIIRVVYPGIYDSNNSKTDTTSDCKPIHFRYSHLKEEGKKNKKKDHPSVPSFDRPDDFSFEKEKEQEKLEIIPGVCLSQKDLDECLEVKGSLEQVKKAMEFIQSNKKRKYSITDWPTALANWKIEDEVKIRVRYNIEYTEKLCKEFPEYDQGHGWKCFMYNDTKKDQRGILFECQSAYQEAFFVSLIDGELKEKCENFIQTKNIRKK